MEFKNSHILLLCIIAFLGTAGGAILGPALPEMSGPLNVTTQTVALLMSVYALSTAIFTLVIGHFIDRVNRKTILVPCLAIYGLTGLVSFFVTDFTSLLALRFIQGAGVAGMMVLALLIIGDVYKGQNSVKPISRVCISLALGAVLAPLIGGGLAVIGWNYPFLFYVISLPFALAVIAMLPETKVQTSAENKNGLSEAFSSLRDSRILYTLFMVFCVFFLLFTVLIYIPFLLKAKFGFGAVISGLMLAFEGVAIMALASRVHSLSTRFSVIRISIVGFVLAGVALIGISFVPSIIAIFLLLLLFGAGYGLAQTAIDVQIVQVSPAQVRGSILSIHTCMKYLGMCFAPIILGIVLVYSDLNTVFVIAGILGLLLALITYGMKKRFEKTSGNPV
jgi:MFS transporter, ACDE family, multidrug resistance protein